MGDPTTGGEKLPTSFITTLAHSTVLVMLKPLTKVYAREHAGSFFLVGDRVVLTADALRSMGIRAAHDAFRVWTVRECDCSLCRNALHVCTDQECANDNGWRHIACASLRHEAKL